MQWVIQSVGRRERAASSESRRVYTGAGARTLVIYMLLRRNVANLTQQVDTAICARVLYRTRNLVNNN